MAVYAATLAVGKLLLTAIYRYSTRDDRLLDQAPDLTTVRFFLIRGLTIPAVFLLSIGISFFSMSAAIWSCFVMLAVGAIIVRRRLAR